MYRHKIVRENIDADMEEIALLKLVSVVLLFERILIT